MPLELPRGKRVFFVAGVIALLVVVSGFALLRESETEELEGPFADFRLEQAETSLVRVTGAADIPDETLGVLFLDIGTGDFDGWYDPKGELFVVAFSGDNRFIAFRRGEPFARDGTPLAVESYLADRQSGVIYGWQGDASLVLAGEASRTNRLAASGGRLLFRIENIEGDDAFAVVDFGSEPRVTATFEAPGRWGLLSPDGTQAAVLGEEVRLADLKTGRITAAGSGDDDANLLDQLLDGSEISLKNTLRGEGLLITVTSRDEEFDGSWVHYDWDGNLLARGTGRELYASPDGSRIAAVDAMFLVDETPFLDVTTVVDTTSGSVDFRVVGAAPGSFGARSTNQWLADNSGVLVRAASVGTMFAMRDGSFKPYVGLPSPTSTSVFAKPISPPGMQPVDEYGNPLIRVNLPVRVQDFVSPWDENGDEFRFLTPHLGHDGGGSGTSIVKPYVDTSGRGGPPLVEVSDQSGSVELRDAPASRVIALLPGTQSVVVHEAQMVRSLDEEDLPAAGRAREVFEIHKAFFARQQRPSAEPPPPDHQIPPLPPIQSMWVRVTTSDGLNGWVLVQAFTEGI